MPQVGDERHAQATNNHRSACTSFPTGVMGGLLWVWMSPGSDGFTEAMMCVATVACSVSVATESQAQSNCKRLRRSQACRRWSRVVSPPVYMYALCFCTSQSLSTFAVTEICTLVVDLSR